MGEIPLAADLYSFDPFARHAFYSAINRSLVRRALTRLDAVRPRGAPWRVVDLARGTGAVTLVILDELERLGRAATVIGIEPSLAAIEIAGTRLEGRPVRLVRGDADDLARVAPDADAVFLCNAIHLLAEKRDVVTTIRRVLGPEGCFACNSTFFRGAQTSDGERFAHLWMRRALSWPRRYHPEMRPTRRGQVAAVVWLAADEYATLLEACGLRLVERTQEVAALPIRAVQDIGRYRLFIDGALPGIPIAIGADALDWAAAEAARELDMASVPRIWPQLVAQREETHWRARGRRQSEPCRGTRHHETRPPKSLRGMRGPAVARSRYRPRRPETSTGQARPRDGASWCPPHGHSGAWQGREPTGACRWARNRFGGPALRADYLATYLATGPTATSRAASIRVGAPTVA